jgi:hypothetical protein
MHYDTFPPIQAEPEAFRALVGNDAEVRILSPGRPWTCPEFPMDRRRDDAGAPQGRTKGGVP